MIMLRSSPSADSSSQHTLLTPYRSGAETPEEEEELALLQRLEQQQVQQQRGGSPGGGGHPEAQEAPPHLRVAGSLENYLPEEGHAEDWPPATARGWNRAGDHLSAENGPAAHAWQPSFAADDEGGGGWSRQTSAQFQSPQFHEEPATTDHATGSHPQAGHASVFGRFEDAQPQSPPGPSLDPSSQQMAGRWTVFGPGITQSGVEAQPAPAAGTPPKAAPVRNPNPPATAGQVGAGKATPGLAEVKFFGKYPPNDKASPRLIGDTKDMLKDERTPPGARPLLIQLPSGEPSKFLVPQDYDPQAVYDAGYEHAKGDTAVQAWKTGQSVGFYGTFDLQRNSGKGRVESGPNTFYPAYTAASNYNVGLYLGGAGRSWEDTERLAKVFALSMSSNAGESDQVKMWKAGWLASQKMSPGNPPPGPPPPPPRQIPIIPYGRSPGAPPPPARVK